ncbi:hypothetical protein NGM99_10125 [Mesorhizobium sp. RP14(2022)]|uniref:Uncharacterized protein n=1 Tax=Mesorhizobium liriopis TaxID=2953882 RepID=A0ABT1C5P8_9HYPH|nr:hypothetical protein [Mesorhizobium liriopis]MCO6050148.1 hypothetical protein [Mesorhizobium liriopis]
MSVWRQTTPGKAQSADDVQSANRSGRGQSTSVFDQRDQAVVCGIARGNACMAYLTFDWSFEDVPGRPEFSTDADKALCRDYYRYFIRTGQSDASIDRHCSERRLRPQMVPDPSR